MDNTMYFKNELIKMGFNTGASETPITPVITGDSIKATRLSQFLWKEGVFVQPIVYPMVAKEKSRVRTIVTASHTREDLEKALKAFCKVGKRLGIIV